MLAIKTDIADETKQKALIQQIINLARGDTSTLSYVEGEIKWNFIKENNDLHIALGFFKENRFHHIRYAESINGFFGMSEKEKLLTQKIIAWKKKSFSLLEELIKKSASQNPSVSK